MEAHDLARRPIHLGLGVTAEVEPAFTNDMACYGAYLVRHICDGSEGRLLSFYTFMEPWGAWEIHPQGSEVLVCAKGSLIRHQEHSDSTTSTVTLAPGQFAINPPGYLAHGGHRRRNDRALHHRRAGYAAPTEKRVELRSFCFSLEKMPCSLEELSIKGVNFC